MYVDMNISPDRLSKCKIYKNIFKYESLPRHYRIYLPIADENEERYIVIKKNYCDEYRDYIELRYDLIDVVTVFVDRMNEKYKRYYQTEWRVLEAQIGNYTKEKLKHGFYYNEKEFKHED